MFSVNSKHIWYWLYGQLAILLFCLIYICYIALVNIAPDKAIKKHYRTTSCVVIAKKLATSGSVFHYWRADFLISYNVANTQYKHWVSGNGLDHSFFKSEEEQEDILSQFDVGSSYTCYYHPANPQWGVLVLRHEWISIFSLLLVSSIFIITLYTSAKTARALLKNGRRLRNQPGRVKHKKMRK